MSTGNSRTYSVGVVDYLTQYETWSQSMTLY